MKFSTSFIFLFVLISALALEGQVSHHFTIQSDGAVGKDADISMAPEYINLNMGNSIYFRAESWTRNGDPNYFRGLISFPIDEIIAGCDTVESIMLTLYKDLEYPWSEGGAHGNNASRLYLLTENWEESVVTWNSQPSYDENYYVDIPTNNDYDSIQIDLTEIIQDCYNRGAPFYGFLLRNTDEQFYKSLNFLSSDTELSHRRPKLDIYCQTSPETCCVWKIFNGTVYYDQGGVAIGSQDAGEYALSVMGTIFSKETLVNPEGWPDYVFESDYDLMQLSALRQYIEENGHLPNIPSAKSVESDGIEIGDISARLLKKIEELTLYLLEADNRIKSLEEKLESLER